MSNSPRHQALRDQLRQLNYDNKALLDQLIGVYDLEDEDAGDKSDLVEREKHKDARKPDKEPD